ncbi:MULTISPECIES: 3-dehydroquinate synthase [Rhodomicrobium]|uniref:3-dehydroquinate synthase n=1 Tax=Rhodomicrobium TaxID=1068 RepID=UPI000B4AE2C9|nr:MULTISPECIES: 3-dehydroquinate synthase [Rhodomicrobium]
MEQVSWSGRAARVVNVPLGTRAYDIAIGSGVLADLGEAVKAMGPARCTVVTDEYVAGLHLHAVRSSLGAAGLRVGEAVMPAGEATKSFPQLQKLCDALLDQGLERRDVVIALGGGVIGDLAGFAASILKRGVRLVQIPTTLLSQVDSSIGGKTGINTSHGKNLIGAFHQPSLVLIDTDVLDTLDARQMRSGYAEVVKYGLLGDAGFFDWLETHWAGIFEGDDAARLTAIETSCRAKAAIVAEDETEWGRRALLNLGHTFGHGLEAWAGYSAKLLHGEAIAIGMVLAFEMSEELGLCPAGLADRVAAHLTAVGLPARIRDVAAMTGGALPRAEELVALMAQDKKAKAGRLAFILVRGIGEAFTSDAVEPERLLAFLKARCGA